MAWESNHDLDDLMTQDLKRLKKKKKRNTLG